MPDPRPRTGDSFHIPEGGRGICPSRIGYTNFCKNVLVLPATILSVIGWNESSVSLTWCYVNDVSLHAVLPDWFTLHCHSIA